MRHLKKYNESTDEMPKKGVLRCKKGFTIGLFGTSQYMNIKLNDIISYDHDDSVKIKILNSKSLISPFQDWGDDYNFLNVEWILKTIKENVQNGNLEMIDISKPYKLEFLNDDLVKYYNTSHQLHRENGPAVIDSKSKGTYWYKNGEIHRDEGPAVTIDGNQHWYKNGKLHREDGPAFIRTSGEVRWYLDGQRYDGDLYKSTLKRRSLKEEITTDQIKDLLTDLEDEFNDMKIKYNDRLFEWEVEFSGGSPTKIYNYLSSLSDRLEYFGLELENEYKNGELSILIYLP
jgi:hypothetical protein